MNLIPDIILCSLSQIIAGIAARIRGGGFVTLNSDFECRLIWGLGFALSYMMLVNINVTLTSMIYLATLPVMGFLSFALIPHAIFQNSGRRNAPWWLSSQDFSPLPFKKYWPGFWMPHYTVAEWNSFSFAKKFCFDFAGSACVGLLRGLIVFLPYLAVSAVLNHLDLATFSLRPFAMAMATIIIMRPVAVALGWVMPITITSSLKARTNLWSEYFEGVAFSLAVGCLA